MLLILPVVHHANKAARDTDCPSRTSPFYQLKPRQETPMVIYLLTTLVWVVYSTYLGFFAGATVSFTFFFVCKQCQQTSTHVNKAAFGREILFIFHLKIKEFPNNLTLPEVLEVWQHARTSLIWPNLSSQEILWVSFAEIFLRLSWKNTRVSTAFIIFLNFIRLKILINVIHIPFVFRILLLTRHLMSTYWLISCLTFHCSTQVQPGDWPVGQFHRIIISEKQKNVQWSERLETLWVKQC